MVLIETLAAFVRRTDPAVWKLVRWSVMAAILFWVLIYRMALPSSSLPDFVYVNF